VPYDHIITILYEYDHIIQAVSLVTYESLYHVIQDLRSFKLLNHMILLSLDTYELR
jgi:hypothetical protein